MWYLLAQQDYNLGITLKNQKQDYRYRNKVEETVNVGPYTTKGGMLYPTGCTKMDFSKENQK